MTSNIYYWSEGAAAEVDFVFSYKNHIIPVEAKAGLVVHAQSLSSFRRKYEPKISIRTSLKPYRNDNGLVNLPLYQIWTVKEILTEVI